MAVVCCAGLPALAAATGGLTFAALMGIAGGVVAALAVGAGAVLFVRARRRRACGLDREAGER